MKTNGIRRRWRTVLLVLLALGLLAGAAGLSLSARVKNSVRGSVVSPEAASDLGADCVLVLGAGVLKDGTPSDMLRDRLDAGIALYFAGAAPKLLMSGDHSRVDYDEVNAMKDWALAAGVPSEDVFMDHAGFSTYESLYRARDVFQVRRVVIVTQQYHLYRALYIARALGLEAVGVASDPRTYGGQALRELREILARDKDYFQCISQPLPTFLGDTTPITGSGDATNDGAA